MHFDSKNASAAFESIYLGTRMEQQVFQFSYQIYTHVGAGRHAVAYVCETWKAQVDLNFSSQVAAAVLCFLLINNFRYHRPTCQTKTQLEN